MPTEDKKRPALTRVLGIIALFSLVLLIAVSLFSLPCFGPAPETGPTTIPTTEATTETPTEESIEETIEETTEPTDPPLPPEFHNPYGPLDFQYDGRYLSCLREQSIPGIDVSSHQRTIDWQAVRDSGIQFAIIRIGYRGYESGALRIDDYAVQNLDGATKAGIDTGVYFFSQAITPEEAVEEANFVLDFVKDYEFSMPIVYDFEFVHRENTRTEGLDADTITACTLAFLETVEAAGYDTMVYFNTYQSNHHLHLAELTDYDFWLALYSDRMRFPYSIRMWQYTNKGRVPGIEGDTDVNLYFPKD